MNCCECGTAVASERTIDGITIIVSNRLRAKTADPFEFRCIYHQRRHKQRRKVFYVQSRECNGTIVFQLVDSDNRPTSHRAQAPANNHFRIKEAIEKLQAVGSLNRYRIEGDEVWNRYA